MIKILWKFKDVIDGFSLVLGGHEVQSEESVELKKAVLDDPLPGPSVDRLNLHFDGRLIITDLEKAIAERMMELLEIRESSRKVNQDNIESLELVREGIKKAKQIEEEIKKQKLIEK